MAHASSPNIESIWPGAKMCAPIGASHAPLSTHPVNSLIDTRLLGYDVERQITWDTKDGHQNDDEEYHANGQAHRPIALVGRL